MELNRGWKSVTSESPKIESDNFIYEIWQTKDGKEIFILGKDNVTGDYKNIGYGKNKEDKELDVGSELSVSWVNLTEDQGMAFHRITVRIESENQIRRCLGSDDVGQLKSYGNWDVK